MMFYIKSAIFSRYVQVMDYNPLRATTGIIADLNYFENLRTHLVTGKTQVISEGEMS